MHESNVLAYKHVTAVSHPVMMQLFLFLCCSAVYHILRDTSGQKKSELENTPEFMKFGLCKDLGYVLNHTGNIVFYCLCNSTYR